MTKDDINRAYTENCVKLGDIEMQLKAVENRKGELEASKDKIIIANLNLSVEMTKAMKEEAPAAPVEAAVV